MQFTPDRWTIRSELHEAAVRQESCALSSPVVVRDEAPVAERGMLSLPDTAWEEAPS